MFTCNDVRDESVRPQMFKSCHYDSHLETKARQMGQEFRQTCSSTSHTKFSQICVWLAGQCGNQIGTEFWKTVRSRHILSLNVPILPEVQMATYALNLLCDTLLIDSLISIDTYCAFCRPLFWPSCFIAKAILAAAGCSHPIKTYLLFHLDIRHALQLNRLDKRLTMLS